ncbi:hypothetical protein ACPBEI_11420 [Latilactobacillus sakei]
MATISIGKFNAETSVGKTGYVTSIKLDVDIFQAGKSKPNLGDITKFIEEIQKIKL